MPVSFPLGVEMGEDKSLFLTYFDYIGLSCYIDVRIYAS